MVSLNSPCLEAIKKRHKKILKRKRKKGRQIPPDLVATICQLHAAPRYMELKHHKNSSKKQENLKTNLKKGSHVVFPVFFFSTLSRAKAVRCTARFPSPKPPWAFVIVE
jgi:hypothetical protein